MGARAKGARPDDPSGSRLLVARLLMYLDVPRSQRSTTTRSTSPTLCAQDKDSYGVMHWLKEAEAKKVKRRGLVGPGPGYILLDRKLANALVTTLTSEIWQTAHHLRERGENRLWGGRDLRLEIFKYLFPGTQQSSADSRTQ